MKYALAGTEDTAFWAAVNWIVAGTGEKPSVIFLSTQKISLVKMFRRSGMSYTFYQIFLWLLPKMVSWLPGGWLRSIAAIAKKHGIKVIESDNISAEANVKILKDLGVTTVFSYSCDHIFKAPMLGKIKILNIHPSALPEYKGVDPLFEQLVNGEGSGALSLHEVTEEIDSGPIVHIEQIHFVDRCHFSRLALCSKIVADLVGAYLEGRYENNSQTQSPAKTPYKSWPTKASMKKLYAMGGSLLGLLG